jgi:hypothetical protein
MEVLTSLETSLVSAGEIIPGWPTPDVTCINTKLMVTAGRGEPGFDVTNAVRALMKACHDDFWDLAQTHEYATSGGIPLPQPAPTP